MKFEREGYCTTIFLFWKYNNEVKITSKCRLVKLKEILICIRQIKAVPLGTEYHLIFVNGGIADRNTIVTYEAK